MEYLFLAILFFVFGLCIGSFLNALIWRIHQKKSMSGRSMCPECKHILSAKDLIPLISYCLLKGKCRYCSKKISIQYPLVEFSFALLIVVNFLVLSFYYPLDNLSLYLLLARNILFFAILMVIFVYDYKWMLIPDKITLPSIIAVFLVSLLINIITPFDLNSASYCFHCYGSNIYINLLVAGLAGGGFFGLQFLLSQGKWIGGGDIRLGFLMGLMVGWPMVILAIFLAYLIGSFWCLVLIVSKKKKMSSKIAFGTFLSIATVLILIFQNEINYLMLNYIFYG